MPEIFREKTSKRMTHWQRTGAMRAVQRNQLSAIRALVEGGVIDPHTLRDEYSGGLLLHAATTFYDAFGSDGALEVFEYLLRLGVDVDVRNLRQATPLHYAADSRAQRKRNIRICRILIACGANVRARDEDSATPCRCAVTNDDSALLRAILLTSELTDACAALEEDTDDGGNTPYSLAAAHFPSAHKVAAAFKANPVRYRSDHSALIHIALGLASLDLPTLLITQVASFAVWVNDELIASYGEAKSWDIAAIVKKKASGVPLLQPAPATTAITMNNTQS